MADAGAPARVRYLGRVALLDDRMPSPVPLIIFAAVAFTVFVSGYWVFTRAKPTFADLL